MQCTHILRAAVVSVTNGTIHRHSTNIDGRIVPGERIRTAVRLEIVPLESGVGLYHFDAEGRGVADTWHPTLDARDAGSNDASTDEADAGTADTSTDDASTTDDASSVDADAVPEWKAFGWVSGALTDQTQLDATEPRTVRLDVVLCAADQWLLGDRCVDAMGHEGSPDVFRSKRR